MKATLDHHLQFNSITHGKVTLEEVILYIKDFLEEKPTFEYSLVIGTDSHERMDSITGKKYIWPVTAIVVRRNGFGGKYFWYKKPQEEVHSLREKIYSETLASLELATLFVPLLKKYLNGETPSYKLEIHVDVGEYGQTRDMIKEVVGMVTGNGFVAKTKPDSYGATYVADKHT